jgi:hypothetical protein
MVASPGHDPSDATKSSGQSVPQTIFTRRHGAVSPDYDCRAIPTGVATIDEQETRSDDEPLIYKGSNKHASGVFTGLQEIKTEAAITRFTGGHEQARSVGTSSKAPVIDLRDDTSEDAVRVKIEPHNDESIGDPLFLQFMSPGASPETYTPNFLMTPTTTPAMTPQPARSIRSPIGGGTSQPINNARTLIFLDSQNRELRRRTFEDLGGRLNVGTLFGQAIRASLIDILDEDAILSVSIRGISEDFKIPRDDKPDFARFMQRIEVAGLCMIEVRLD